MKLLCTVGCYNNNININKVWTAKNGDLKIALCAYNQLANTEVTVVSNGVCVGADHPGHNAFCHLISLDMVSYYWAGCNSLYYRKYCTSVEMWGVPVFPFC